MSRGISSGATSMFVKPSAMSITSQPPHGRAFKVVGNLRPRSASLSRQRNRSRLRSCITVEDPLTRVRHTSYGSQPNGGGACLSRPFALPVNSSFAVGDLPSTAARPSTPSRFSCLRSGLFP
jgi:hypothetical protein